MEKENSSDGGKEISLRDLYPNLSEKQQQEVEYNLTRYLEIIKEIFEEKLFKEKLKGPLQGQGREAN